VEIATVENSDVFFITRRNIDLQKSAQTQALDRSKFSLQASNEVAYPGAQTLVDSGTLFLLEQQPPIVIAVGRAVRKQRRLLDMSQQSLAARAHVNPSHLSQIECGRRDPHSSTVNKLAQGLGLSWIGLAAVTDEELAILEEKSDPLG